MARTDATEKAKAAAKAAKDAKPPPPPLTPADVFSRSLVLLEKFAETRDSILLSRVLRVTRHVRMYLPVSILRSAIEAHVGAERRAGVLAALDGAVAAGAVASTAPTGGAPAASSSASAPADPSTAASSALKMPRVGGPASQEVDAYLSYIVLAKVALTRNWAALSDSANALISFISPLNKRSLDWFQVRGGSAALYCREAPWSMGH
jgi:hypothetical protein